MVKKIIIYVLMIICLFGIGYSLYNIFTWNNDNKKTDEIIKKVQEELDEETNTYNFEELRKINQEIVGWIKVDGTNVDYPFVKHKDNSYYLTHSLDNSYNNAGWVFEDYRYKDNDFNRIIYAHGRVDGTMFGSLKDALDDSWLKSNNHYIYVYDDSNEYVYQIFSLYHIDTTDDYLSINDNSLKFISLLMSRSVYNFDVEVNSDDKIITLSTCYNDKEKLVIHGKLIDNKNVG